MKDKLDDTVQPTDKDGGLYKNVKMTAKEADVLVIVCAVLFVCLVVLLAVLGKV